MVDINSEADAVLPPAARLVRDFVNSVEWQVDEESWKTPTDLTSWFESHTGVSVPGLTEADVLLARRIREGLRAVLLAHAGHDPLPTAIDDLNAALADVPLKMEFAPAGGVGLVSLGRAPLTVPISRILDAIDTGHRDGSWDRLKACSRDSCRWVYWDNSRNRSGRWCSMPGCGNYIKMQRRNGASPPPAETLPRGDLGIRPPTVVDVAGRAGVSIKTVSNVVNGVDHVSARTRGRVESAIAELGYRPNLAARALRTGRAIVETTSDEDSRR